MLQDASTATPYLGTGEFGFRLDTLSKAWNQLRNDVLGRGLVPPKGVSAALAEKVGNQWDEWRIWYNDAAKSFLSVSAFFHYGSEESRALDEWTKRYTNLRDEALSALGKQIKAPAAVPVSNLDLLGGLQEMAVWGAVGGFALAMFWVWLRRPRPIQQPKSEAIGPRPMQQSKTEATGLKGVGSRRRKACVR